MYVWKYKRYQQFEWYRLLGESWPKNSRVRRRFSTNPVTFMKEILIWFRLWLCLTVTHARKPCISFPRPVTSIFRKLPSQERFPKVVTTWTLYDRCHVKSTLQTFPPIKSGQTLLRCQIHAVIQVRSNDGITVTSRTTTLPTCQQCPLDLLQPRLPVSIRAEPSSDDREHFVLPGFDQQAGGVHRWGFSALAGALFSQTERCHRTHIRHSVVATGQLVLKTGHWVIFCDCQRSKIWVNAWNVPQVRSILNASPRSKYIKEKEN